MSWCWPSMVTVAPPAIWIFTPVAVMRMSASMVFGAVLFTGRTSMPVFVTVLLFAVTRSAFPVFRALKKSPLRVIHSRCSQGLYHGTK